eukprot:CAMPEP_0167824554 /NCGR_PEP_ID=MMETSP0112_2-20121227/8859_1 /TAXON_ID=91324 /ORGANISM="Lotharella globosa, Strain CCCM811" /LENGTH=131 /DNA_ID=CAMNT_0007726531 /DNA_START=206 /DNA_END=604 /DNA_ORIENTATION=-
MQTYRGSWFTPGMIPQGGGGITVDMLGHAANQIPNSPEKESEDSSGELEKEREMCGPGVDQDTGGVTLSQARQEESAEGGSGAEGEEAVVVAALGGRLNDKIEQLARAQSPESEHRHEGKGKDGPNGGGSQ